MSVSKAKNTKIIDQPTDLSTIENSVKLDNKPAKSYPSHVNKKIILAYILPSLILLLGFSVYFLVPFSHYELRSSAISYQTNLIDDSTTELGQDQIRQQGENGTQETDFRVRRTLSGKVVSHETLQARVVKPPISKIIAKGTKKYQYMWCSNGSYRFYTSDQFKSPSAGFTHQSADFCEQNKQGHMTNLADAAPVAAQAPTSTYRSYTPTYPSYTAPRTCNTQYHTYGGYYDPSATTTCY